MAIPAQNLAPLPSGAPTLSPASAGISGPGDAQEPFVCGIATFVLDGATTTAVLNWIDGTATLPFTPSAVFAQLVPGGTQAGTVALASVAPGPVTTISATSCTVTLTAAGTNANTIKVLFVAYK